MHIPATAAVHGLEHSAHVLQPVSADTHRARFIAASSSLLDPREDSQFGPTAGSTGGSEIHVVDVAVEGGQANATFAKFFHDEGPILQLAPSSRHINQLATLYPTWDAQRGCSYDISLWALAVDDPSNPLDAVSPHHSGDAGGAVSRFANIVGTTEQITTFKNKELPFATINVLSWDDQDRVLAVGGNTTENGLAFGLWDVETKKSTYLDSSIFGTSRKYHAMTQLKPVSSNLYVVQGESQISVVDTRVEPSSSASVVYNIGQDTGVFGYTPMAFDTLDSTSTTLAVGGSDNLIRFMDLRFNSRSKTELVATFDINNQSGAFLPFNGGVKSLSVAPLKEGSGLYHILACDQVGTVASWEFNSQLSSSKAATVESADSNKNHQRLPLHVRNDQEQADSVYTHYLERHLSKSTTTDDEKKQVPDDEPRTQVKCKSSFTVDASVDVSSVCISSADPSCYATLLSDGTLIVDTF